MPYEGHHVLPTYPESHDPPPPRPNVPRQPPPTSVLALAYCAAGIVSGSVTGGITAGLDFAFLQWVHPVLPAPDPVAAFIAGLFVGVFPGLLCGLILWMTVSYWPAARHPVRAGSLCASVGGTFCLIMLVSQGVEIRPEDLKALVGLAAVVGLGAIFGFLTSWLAGFLERMVDRTRA